MCADTGNSGDANRTAWARQVETPLRQFLRTETGSAAVVLSGAIAALIWVDIDSGSYARVWRATLSIQIAGVGPSHDLRFWVNSGLMTLFFFVAGLEVRREFDMGELRERRRVALPLVAGLGGVFVPVGVFLAFDASHGSAKGWGITMSTDTAFALGMLALVGKGIPDRLRIFMLTVSIVDDLVALLVIATVYSTGVSTVPLLAGFALFGVIVLAVIVGIHRGLLYATLGAAAWLALSESGIDPIVIGLAMGLLTPAAPVARGDLERASGPVPPFREQPTPDLARTARLGLESAISPTSGSSASSTRGRATSSCRSSRSPTPGSWSMPHSSATPSRHRSPSGSSLLRRSESRSVCSCRHGWRAGSAMDGSDRPSAGRRWRGRDHRGNRVHGLAADRRPRLPGRGPRGRQVGHPHSDRRGVCPHLADIPGHGEDARAPAARALLGTGQSIIDLAVPVDPDRDRIRGPQDSLVTVVEYWRLECPYCGHAEPVCASCFVTSETCVTSGVTCRSTTCTRRPSWRPKPLRPPPCKGPSGRCTTGCSSIRGPWAWLI